MLSFLATVLLLCMGLRKKTFSRQLTIAKKKILLSTVLCIGINIRPPPGKKLFLTIILLWCMGLWKNSITLNPRRKKNLVIVLLWYMGLEKTQSAFDPHWKKNWFLATILLWCMGLRKKLIPLGPRLKKYIFISDYSTTVVHMTWKNFNRLSTP